MHDVKLRDQRRPGHCWQDNELYDAFGPIIGGDAVLVYVALSRHCYGTEVRASSRELAESIGKSKDTVLRALKVMERVGMLRTLAGGSRRVAEYHLVDLKELAIHYGGQRDSKRACYLLPDAEVRRMKAEVAALLQEQRRGLSPAVQKGDGGTSVALGDRCAEASLAPVETVLGAGGDTTVSRDAQPNSYVQDTRQQDTATPTPSLGEGGGDDADARDERIAELRAEVRAMQRSGVGVDWREKAQELLRLVRERETQQSQAVSAVVEAGPEEPPETDDLDALTAWVMRRCGFTHKRARWAIRTALSEEPKATRHRLPAGMVASWENQLRQGTKLRWHKSPQNFFRDSYWRREQQWPWDLERMERKSLAEVGAR